MIKDLSHLGTYLKKTPVGKKDFAHTMNGRVVKETDDGSLFSSCVIVSLLSTLSDNCFYIMKSVIDDDMLRVVTLQEKISHLLSFGFEVVIDGAKTAKS